ncbi:MAG: hypothetical protein AAGB05_04655 [Pseudomonadota bacterium]
MSDFNTIDTLSIDQRARQMRGEEVARQMRALATWIGSRFSARTAG